MFMVWVAEIEESGGVWVALSRGNFRRPEAENDEKEDDDIDFNGGIDVEIRGGGRRRGEA